MALQTEVNVFRNFRSRYSVFNLTQRNELNVRNRSAYFNIVVYQPFKYIRYSQLLVISLDKSALVMNVAILHLRRITLLVNKNIII